MPEKELEPIPSQTRAIMERIVLKEIGGSVKTAPIMFARHGDDASLFLADRELGRAVFEEGLWRTRGFPGCTNLVDILEYWLRAHVAVIAAALTKE
jgi:hypothetical protein